jgi:hypothetical protein
MKDITILALANLPACLCASAAAYMAINSINGWGWFLAVAVCVCITRVKTNDKA